MRACRWMQPAVGGELGCCAAVKATHTRRLEAHTIPIIDIQIPVHIRIRALQEAAHSLTSFALADLWVLCLGTRFSMRHPKRMRPFGTP